MPRRDILLYRLNDYYNASCNYIYYTSPSLRQNRLKYKGRIFSGLYSNPYIIISKEE